MPLLQDQDQVHGHVLGNWTVHHGHVWHIGRGGVGEEEAVCKQEAGEERKHQEEKEEVNN